MRRVLAALAVLALVAGASGGCASTRGTIAPLLIELRDGATQSSFTQLLTTARRRGYTIEFAEPEYGVFGVRARGRLGRQLSDAMLVVQCYADGRAVLSVLGGTPAPNGRSRVPDELRREAIALAQALEESR